MYVCFRFTAFTIDCVMILNASHKLDHLVSFCNVVTVSPAKHHLTNVMMFLQDISRLKICGMIRLTE